MDVRFYLLFTCRVCSACCGFDIKAQRCILCRLRESCLHRGVSEGKTFTVVSVVNIYRLLRADKLANFQPRGSALFLGRLHTKTSRQIIYVSTVA